MALSDIYLIGSRALDDDAYYCNKELVQLLVFDAKVTEVYFCSRNFRMISFIVRSQITATDPGNLRAKRRGEF